MTELSNAVTVLIARMESHPDDFELNEGELYSRSKFGDTVNGLYALTDAESPVKNAFWYLSDADKQALAEAWKKYHYTKFEKKVMEKIFDDGEGERELAKVNQQLYQAQQRAMIKNQMMQSTGTFGSVGQITPLHNNPNQGLLSSAGSAFQGLFK